MHVIPHQKIQLRICSFSISEYSFAGFDLVEFLEQFPKNHTNSLPFFLIFRRLFLSLLEIFKANNQDPSKFFFFKVLQGSFFVFEFVVVV